MKSILALGLAAGLLAAGGAARATDVGVSIGISQPGVYGRIDIGRFPQPAVILPQPIIVRPAPVVVAPPEPVYLWVPPGHRKNWRRYCARYNACGVPVMFVQDRWYREHVRPAAPPPPRPLYRGERFEPAPEHGPGHGRGHGHDKGHGRGHGRD